MDGFVMTEADAAQALAERQAQTRAMLAEVDYARYLEAQAEQLAAEIEEEPGRPAPRCLECRDTRTVRYSVGWGLSDWIEEACPFCRRPRPALALVEPKKHASNVVAFPVADAPRPAA